MTSHQQMSQPAIQHMIESVEATHQSTTKAQDFQITPWHHDPMVVPHAGNGCLR